MRRLVRLALLLAPTLPLGACEERAPSATPDRADVPAVSDGYVEAADGVRLFYRIVGAGGDTLVVLHGGPGFTLDYLADDLEPLSERLTLLFYDQRGAGRSSLVSDSAALDARRFADDLEAVRRHFGLERIDLLAHSWGAAVAALYAGRYPDRVADLVVVGGVPPRREGLVRAFEGLEAGRDSATLRRMGELRQARLADPGDAEACRAYYVLWFAPFFGDGAAMRRSRGDFCAGSPDALRNKVVGVDRYTMASLGEYDWRASLAAVRARTLVIHGTADPLPLDGAREWAAALPESRLLVLDGVGHFPWLERPGAFFPAVEAFVLGRWPEGAERVAEGGSGGS